jgi:hypothetical protein
MLGNHTVSGLRVVAAGLFPAVVSSSARFPTILHNLRTISTMFLLGKAQLKPVIGRRRTPPSDPLPLTPRVAPGAERPFESVISEAQSLFTEATQRGCWKSW